jgi:hypothetical protein
MLRPRATVLRNRLSQVRLRPEKQDTPPPLFSKQKTHTLWLGIDEPQLLAVIDNPIPPMLRILMPFPATLKT